MMSLLDCFSLASCDDQLRVHPTDEYDTGNWRAPRHRLSHPDYIRNYKLRYPPSEPVEDWDARNLLYSLTFNMGNIYQIPGSTQRPVVYGDMTTLCHMFFPDDLRKRLEEVSALTGYLEGGEKASDGQVTVGAEALEEEEEEQEELDWKRQETSPVIGADTLAGSIQGQNKRAPESNTVYCDGVE